MHTKNRSYTGDELTKISSDSGFYSLTYGSFGQLTKVRVGNDSSRPFLASYTYGRFSKREVLTDCYTRGTKHGKAGTETEFRWTVGKMMSAK